MSATFTIPRRQLLDAIKAAGQIVPRRSLRPVLQNVRLSVNGRVKLFASNPEQSLLLPLDVPHEGEAAVLVAPSQLQKTLNRLKGKDITLRIEDDGSVTVITDGGESNFPSEFKSTDYPTCAFEEPAAWIVLAGRDLANALRQTMFCADDESSRYALGGVQFELSAGKLTLCATDTRRLAVIDIPVGGEFSERRDGVIPLTACEVLLRQIRDDSVVLFDMNESGATFRLGETRLATRFVEGRFPRWNDVIPMMGNHQLELPRAEFRQALEAVRTGQTAEARECEFTILDDDLLLECGRADTGISRSRCHIRSQDSTGRRVAHIDFDPAYLIDYLDWLPSSCAVVQMSMIDAESAAILTSAGAGLYVVMPLSREATPKESFQPGPIVAAVKGATAYVVSLTNAIDRQQTALTLRHMRSNPLGRGVLEHQIRQRLGA